MSAVIEVIHYGVIVLVAIALLGLLLVGRRPDRPGEDDPRNFY